MSGTFDAWVGRTEDAEDVISLRQARQMAATLGAAGDNWAALPPLWHWMGWTPLTQQSGLGSDGHPARGGFLPPVPLERRMWAGGRLSFLAPLKIGETMQRRSEILKVAEKTGATGLMVFVTVGHKIYGQSGLCVTEEQDIVYVAMPDSYAPPPAQPAADGAAWSEPVAIDTVRLFRFSALTFNAHRIHFDLPYATEIEKYPGLVVHGPLQAMLLMQAACRNQKAAPRHFKFRGRSPLLQFNDLGLGGGAVVNAVQTLSTVADNAAVCMQAEIGWLE